MQPSTASVRGYSDFFASGFRAVTNRASYGQQSAEVDHQKASSSSFPSARLSLADITQRRPRPSSMFIQKSASPSSSVQEKSPPPRSRRSSFVSFSSRLFDRITSAYGDDNSFISSRRARRSSLKATKDVSGLWVATGSTHTPIAPNGSALHHTIDPFTSSPDARSMFIDLSSSSDGSPVNTPRRESFLSLTGSSPSNRSSSILLTTSSRRERPTSIQTMPLPSRSRRSSWHYRAPSQEKSDSFFLILEEEPSLPTSPTETQHIFSPTTILEQQDDEQDDWDAPAKIDWHQFHIDVLNDDA